MNNGLQQAIIELSKNFEKQSSQLAAINKLVTNTIEHNSEIDVCEEAIKVLIAFEGIHKASIYLVRGSNLHLAASKNLDDFLYYNSDEAAYFNPQNIVPIGENTASSVVQTKKQIFLDRDEINPAIYTSTHEEENSTPCICTPIIYKSQVVGVLNTFGHMFEERKEQLLQFLPLYCGVLTGLLNNAKSVGSMQNDIFRQQSELEFALAKATKVSEAKTSFILGMSHDLRSPLNSILGFSQLLELRPDITEDSLKYVGLIASAGNHLLELINQILDLSEVEAGTTKIRPESTDCYDVINSCSNLLRSQLESNSISLINYIEPNELPRVFVDKMKMKQIVINLITNAIKYNKPQGCITLSSCVSDTHVTLFIEDQGPGIPGDMVNAIFSPFMRLEMETSKIEGTGLGLALSKNLVELMGGDIGVTPAQNEGSCFWFTLPIMNSIENERT